MYEIKTKITNQDFKEYIDGLNDDRREDILKLIEIMSEISQEAPKMWGTSIIGFGKVKYKYASGHNGETAKIGFSPRKHFLTLYLGYNFEEVKNLLNQLGKYRIGKSCLYIKKLDDINIKVLKQIIVESMKISDQLFPEVN
jgi:hypothetical protein